MYNVSFQSSFVLNPSGGYVQYKANINFGAYFINVKRSLSADVLASDYYLEASWLDVMDEAFACFVLELRNHRVSLKGISDLLEREWSQFDDEYSKTRLSDAIMYITKLNCRVFSVDE